MNLEHRTKHSDPEKQLAWLQDSKLTDPRLDNRLTKGLETEVLVQEPGTKRKDPLGLNVEREI